MLSRILETFTSGMIDAYWSFVTSPLVLGILIIGAIVCRILAAITIMPEQYRWPCRPLAYLLAAFFFVNIGHRIADQRAEVKSLTASLDDARSQITRSDQTAAAASRLAAEAKSTAAAIQTKVTTYGLDFPPSPPAQGAASCGPRLITVDQSGRLRDIAAGQAGARVRSSFAARLRKLGEHR
jgi:hypothetical protein